MDRLCDAACCRSGQFCPKSSESGNQKSANQLFNHLYIYTYIWKPYNTDALGGYIYIDQVEAELEESYGELAVSPFF